MGICGTWWLWFYGIILILSGGSPILLIFGILTFIPIYIISVISANEPYNKKKGLVNLLSAISIIYMNINGIDSRISIALFATTLALQYMVNSLTQRMSRTQRFKNLKRAETGSLNLIILNSRYIEDRINWVYRTGAFLYAVAISSSIASFILNQIMVNSRLTQTMTLVSLVLFLIYFTPKVNPRLESVGNPDKVM